MKLKRTRTKGTTLYHVYKQKWIKLGPINDPQTYQRYQTIEAAIEAQAGQVGTVRELAAAYSDLINKPGNPLDLSPRTAIEYQRQLATGSALMSAFGDAPLVALKPVHIGNYLDDRSAPVAANREIALLSKMCRYAMRRGWMDANPCQGVSKNREKPRQRYVTDAEFQAVHQIAPESVQRAMTISYLTGLRLGDVLRIKRADFDREYLYVAEGKTGKRVRYHMTPDLRAALVVSGVVQPQSVVFNRSNRPYTSNGFSSVWQATMTKAFDSGAIAERYHFHDIRAKHASDRTERDMDDAQHTLGHSSAKMTDVYLRHPLGRKVVPLK